MADALASRICSSGQQDWATIFRPAKLLWRRRTSAPVRPAKFPSIQSFFYLVEREVVVPNGLRYIGLSVQAEPRALLAESEKEPGRQLSQAGLPVGITIPTRKRTALQYAFEPLTASLRRSFTEH